MADTVLGEAAAGEPATTCDAFLGGRLTLRQPARGHRAGTDAILLAAAVPTSFSGMVCDVGAGVGAAGLALAARCPEAQVRLIENDSAAATLAAINIEANAASRADLFEIDVLAARERRAALGDRADLVVTNPPFYDPGSFRLSPDARRRAAHVMAPGDLAGWVEACLDLLGPKGSLVLIHRAEAALALVEALGGAAARGLTLLPVHPRAGSDASRVLVRAVKESRAPLRIAPPLVLHEDGGRFTAEAERLHRGEAALRW